MPPAKSYTLDLRGVSYVSATVDERNSTTPHVPSPLRFVQGVRTSRGEGSGGAGGGAFPNGAMEDRRCPTRTEKGSEWAVGSKGNMEGLRGEEGNNTHHIEM
mmetsp:Transcript_1543/g.4191  ORF Transcript_1543/g.4191 Transcript_1543/m.4191 type:complete len:102 (+) Transcript_1543:416-721(+)